MGFEFYKESYAGAIKEISIGEGSRAVTVGGETCYPFCQFEGEIPHKPKVAMEVWDMEPKDWPEASMSHFKDVVKDPAAWAKKCVEAYGAEIIVLQLKSADPNGLNYTPEAISSVVKKILKTIDVPLIIWGVANAEKDELVLRKIAEDCQEYNLILGPVEDKNYKSIAAAAMGYGHYLISSSPIDVNLAKQVNILLENLGMPMDKVFIDPTTGGLGYGLEYSYSVMERLRMAALTQGDDKLQMPIINNLGNEVWKCKEVKLGIDDAPLLGDPERRGILMEAVGAVSYLLAGSNIIFMRHPEAVRLVRSYINLMIDGGLGLEISSIKKQLGEVAIDLESLSPELDLTLEKESDSKTDKKKVISVDKESKSKKVVTVAKVIDKSKSASSKESIINAKLDNINKVGSEEPKVVDKKAVIDADIEDRLRTERQLEVELEVKRKIALEIEAKKKAEEDHRLAKLKEEAAAIAKEVMEREKEEEALKLKRAEERVKLKITQINKKKSTLKMTPASEQKENFEKIVDRLKWVHRRVMLYKW